MSYEINSPIDVVKAISKGIPLVITHANEQDPLSIHGQIYVPNVGNHGCGIVYEGLFWARSIGLVDGMTIIDTARHKSDYDGIRFGTRDFILRKQHVNSAHYQKGYLQKYCHQSQDSKYKIIAYPELTPELIEAAASSKRFNGKTYPEYNCHTFINDAIIDALELSQLNETTIKVSDTPKLVFSESYSSTSYSDSEQTSSRHSNSKHSNRCCVLL
ncbi:hypothetical protein L3V82_12515 [Thiotrichales bacterium 19S3-7]|nr:hypothetical protein [Thiotrichales bacterium 19S3-7]MCF6803014.1 hypothetical protein [Thiotrichales bacterium 19S3-11]